MFLFDKFIPGALRRRMERASESPDFILGWIRCSVHQGPRSMFWCHVTCKCLNEEYTGLGNEARLFIAKNFPNQSSALGKLSEEVHLASQEFKGCTFVMRLGGKCFQLKYPDRDWQEDPPKRLKCRACGKEKTLDAHWFWDSPDYLIPLCDCDGELHRVSDENRTS